MHQFYWQRIILLIVQELSKSLKLSNLKLITVLSSVLVRRREGPATELVKVMAGIILERGARVLEPQHI